MRSTILLYRFCLSVRLWYHISVNAPIIKLFVPSVEEIIPVFFNPTPLEKFLGEPPSAWVLNAQGVGKICEFRLKWPFI